MPAQAETSEERATEIAEVRRLNLQYKADAIERLRKIRTDSGSSVAERTAATIIMKRFEKI